MRKPILAAAVIAVALLTCTVSTAETAQFTTDPNAGTDVVVVDIPQPLAPWTITQSTDPDTLVAGTSVACNAGGNTTENSWLRLFDLDGDHGWPGTFYVESVDWGTEVVDGAQPLEVNVYCLDQTLPFLYQFMTLKDMVSVPLTDETLTFHNTAIGGSCETATEDLAIDLHAPTDCTAGGCIKLFIGMNDLGQTAPTYIASASCGITDPVDLAGIGFPNAHLVMKVNAQGDCCDDGGDDDGGDVPATTGLGTVLLLLILLGSGAYSLRRRAVI
jgi:hypothetical protein